MENYPAVSIPLHTEVEGKQEETAAYRVLNGMIKKKEVLHIDIKTPEEEANYRELLQAQIITLEDNKRGRKPS